MMNVSIRKMRAFLAIVEEQSFTRAAQKQFISQPAITIIVNQIEEELGQQLFVRQGKSRTAELTNSGKAVSQTFARVVANFDTEVGALSTISTGNRETKSLLIQSSIAPFLSAEWLARTIDLLGDATIKVAEVSRDVIINETYERKAAIGILDGAVDQERADWISLSEFKLVLAAPNVGALPNCDSEKDVSVGDLPDDTLIYAGLSSDLERALGSACRTEGKSLDDFDRIAGFSSLISLITNTPRPVIIPEQAAGTLQSSEDWHVRNIGPGKIQSLVGLVTPWGYMNQLKLKHIRNVPCFVSVNVEPLES